MTGHPIRDEPIYVWQAPTDQPGPAWLAKFRTGESYPIFFVGASEADVREKAEAFRADVVRKHEATFLARLAAVEKARAAVAKRKRAVDSVQVSEQAAAP